MSVNSLVGQKLYNGRYEVKSYIGSGGMSHVYEGFDTEVNRRVAIKVLRPELSENSYWVKIFNEEAITAEQCHHPRIVTIYGRKTEGNLHYIVMPFLPIGLKTMLKSEKTLPPLKAVTILRDIAEALVYVHKKNIVHKDIKTGNIMFDEHDYAILTDFGIAKRDDTTRIAGSTGAGTPAYMAPEQCKGEVGDFRSDIYSLGIVLYELLTGKCPYEAEGDVAVYYKHIDEPLPEQPLKDHQVPQRIKNILYKCLAKSPNDRYQSTQELVEAFDDIIKNPPTPKPIRIKRRLKPAIAIPIVFVVAVLVYFLIKAIIGNGNGGNRVEKSEQHISPIAKISLTLLDAEEKQPIPYPGTSGKITIKSPNMETTVVVSKSNFIVEFDTNKINTLSNSDISNNNIVLKMYLPKQDVGSMITTKNKIDYYEPSSLRIKINPNHTKNETLFSSPIAKWCPNCRTPFKYGDIKCSNINCNKERRK